MFNLIRADLFKLRKSMMIKVLFAITTICAAAMAAIAYYIANGRVEGLNGIGFLFSDVSVISIIGAVVAGASICGDFDNKTIHDAISCGYSRGIVIISKAMVFFCAIAFLLLPYAVATVIAIGSGASFNMGSASLGFLNLLMKDYETALSAGVFFRLFSISLILVLVYMAQLSICVPLALILKKPILLVAVFYTLSIISGQLAALKGKYPAFDTIYSFTPYGGNHAFVTLDMGVGDMVRAIVVSLVFIIVMLVITHGIFKKSEIK